MRGAWVPGGRVAWTFLGLFIILGRLSLRPGPIGAFELGRLARGTESGPMVPTMPPFFPAGEGNRPRLEKKGTSLTVISWGIVGHQCCWISM